MSKGYVWGIASVLLVSVAQLLMKWGMMQLPPLSLSMTLPTAESLTPLLAVAAGVAGYGLSMLCWLMALRTLALSRAYPLLSISYALVYLAAVALPCFNESASLPKSLGTLLILLGVWLITRRKARQR
ncbi:4-amino-4-deoxy-L-arabinose-phosphoundecaprenol flippase subunit ArnF [Serratia rubidaea]|uniref:Probable 4-amino-4-deoxy-L-arabinose-phosphoundecaprenol flippase subunit ArnF n=1 Tax=Serratia rubidaea TaxID=61652 RepID=A0A447QTK8_SERRU|nr:4-amino-4-deoxy-L-arabinose-phosphoundecaprenol flippase subunit ArnF [Serratia rubidaea]AML58834.1 Polymyxin resistance protein PmrM [Serratia rubidaea]MBD8451822.1 4-amino-4-deoxy-L-arabinose-phosphoundecaprenol flippase subunit ArnF [Serratia rubidaea]MBS0975575.1 4-amino-4-deoxy-L-arabinose-phosphoundecaprenol flippase subunit ArnF [Serratia rubidaea]MCR0998426.1 4-amino-4-deoxy-L-arabinose-phosphoundecaprenol flippase subunit ArnF [Serratia rubidaea]UJD80062.1 4-amino-4-deoxy-L-arabino